MEGAGLGFSNLEQLAGLDCSGLDLVDQGGSDDCSHEVGKHGVLHSNGGVLDFPKGETVHEAAEHHKQQLGQEVVDIAVELGPCASENEAELSVVGSSKLGDGRRSSSSCISCISCISSTISISSINSSPSHLLHLPAHFAILLALSPHISPIPVRHSRGTCPNHLQHVLGRVFVRLAAPGPLRLKVREHRVRIAAHWAKIDRLAALFQQQQAVELLEKRRRRLVDRAKYRLARQCKFPEHLDDRPGRL